MTNLEQYASTTEVVAERDYIAKHKELLLIAANYIDRVNVWPHDFRRDAEELGYTLEHTEALMLLSEAQQQGMTPRLAKLQQWKKEDDLNNEKKVWAVHAPWNQEERI